MSRQTLADHRLLVFLFAPLTGDNGPRAHGQLRDVWHVAGSRLDIKDPVGPVPAPADPPPYTAHGYPSGLVAGRGSSGASLREMWWDNVGDVAALSIALSQHACSWRELHDEWLTASDGIDLDAMVGMAHIFTALHDGSDLAKCRHAVAEELPVQAHPGWERTYLGLLHEVAMWQTSPPGKELRPRQLIVVAPPNGDEHLGTLVWTRNLALLPRYLLNAAKLHYQARILTSDRVGLHAQRIRIATSLDRLRGLIAPASATVEEGALHRMRMEVDLLQIEEAGVVDALTQARMMRRTVEIASANMAGIARALCGPYGHVPERRASRTPEDPFAVDHRMAEELVQDLDDEAAYLEAAGERARHLGAAIDKDLNARARRAMQESRSRQERLALTQTAVIGTVLTAMTAVQTLDYHLPLPSPAKPAVVASLGALALMFSMKALRQARPDSLEPTVRGKQLVVVVETAACGAVVASITWTAGALASAAGWIPASLLTTIAAGGFLIGVGGAIWVMRRRARAR